MWDVKTGAKWFALCCIVLFSNNILAGGAGDFTFGAQPLIPAIYLEQRYAPFVRQMSIILDRPVRFRTRPDWASYLEAIEAEAFDMAVINPLDYLKVRNTINYQVIASRKPAFAYFFAHDVNVDSVEKLRHKKIGMPPLQAAATKAGLLTLMRAGIFPNEMESHIFKDHMDCKQALITDRVEACISVQSFSEGNHLAEAAEELNFVGSSMVLPGSAVILHNRHKDLAAKLSAWLLGLSETEEGREALQQNFLEVLEPGSKDVYEDWLTANGKDLEKLQAIIETGAL